jgi:hypothetical protein
VSRLGLATRRLSSEENKGEKENELRGLMRKKCL